MISLKLTRRHGLIALAAAAFPDIAPTRAGDAPAGGLVILTVGGLAGAPNRGPFDANRDRFFDHNNLSFKSARAFTEADLLRLPQHTVTAEVYGSGITATGPFLREVLAMTAPLSTAKTARFFALDGYGAEIPLADIQSQDWILATAIDGQPLTIGAFGPLYLMRQLPAGVKKTEEESDKWVHSLYYIELLP
jgi:hypothetical protein